ncbi:MAG TPA: methyltransferase [Pseudonocardia sp.]
MSGSVEATLVSPQVRLLRMIYGAVTARVLALAAELELADRVADGPKPATELAAATGTNADALRRVLRTLAGTGVFTEVSPGVFGQTPLSAVLRAGVSGSIRDAVLELGSAETFGSLMGLEHSVRTGEPAFDGVFGQDWWSYLADRPARAEVFNNIQTITSRQVHALVLEPYDLSGARRLVDVGGGHGTLVAAMLRRYPELTGVVFDQPAVVAGADRTLDEAGVSDRARTVGGDFFESVPAGGDVYLLSMILHDWDDRHSLRILTNIRSAMAPGGRLLVIDPVLPEDDSPHIGKFTDIYMLMHFAGRERTEAEFVRLFAAAGLRHLETRHSGAPSSLLVAEAS